jgi:cytochrome c oxidase cbb3-type subunit 3
MIADGDEEAIKIYEKFNKTQMTAFAGLISNAEMDQLLDYLKVAAPEAAPAPQSLTKNPAPVVVAKGIPDQEKMLIAGLTAFFMLVAAALVAVVAQLYSLVNHYKAAENAGQVKEITTLGAGNFFQDIAGLFDVTVNNRIMEDHSYDGIQEMDNGMPGWLAYFFYGTIAFGVVYILNYHVFKFNDLQEAEYKAEMAEAALRYGDMADRVSIQLVQLTGKDQIASGQLVYDQNCAVCHGKAGEGGVGPNLTDEYWIHGGKVEDIFTIIREGVAAKGMIPWKGKLSDEEMLQTASFIMSLKGTNPPNAKAPQGEKVD